MVASTITVFQDPPGSGKTYRLVRDYLLRAGELGYDNVFVVTKPHSAKEVVRKELIEQIEEAGGRITLTEHIHNNAFIMNVVLPNVDGLEPTPVTIFIATGDSFLYSQWRIRTGPQTDMFDRMCHQISEDGPKYITMFKGKNARVNERSLVCIDEATKFDSRYTDTFLKVARVTECDIVVTGDILQSIEFEDNLLTDLCSGQKSCDDVKVTVHRGDQVRRCGPDLVNFFTSIVGSRTYEREGMNMPRSFFATSGEKPSSYRIMPPVLDPMDLEDPRSNYKTGELPPRLKAIEAFASAVAGEMVHDVKRMRLLPNDVIVVTPLVNKNLIANALQVCLETAWAGLFLDPDYRRTMEAERRDEFESYMAMERTWHVVLHHSESGRPIDTSRSRNSTRIVSVHASQGDGRRLAITVNLSQRNLCKFVHASNATESRRYASFINVALSRCKEHQTVWLWKKDDDIFRRFLPCISNSEPIDPSLTGLSKYANTSFVRIDPGALPEGDLDEDMATPIDGVVEYEHHAVAFEVFLMRACMHLGTKRGGFWNFLGRIKNGKIVKLEPKLFFRRKKPKDRAGTDVGPLSEDWPVIDYTGDAWKSDALDTIEQHMNDLGPDGRMITEFVTAMPTDRAHTRLMSSVHPMHLVCLRYVHAMNEEGSDRSLSCCTLYDIARAYTHGGHITNMYDRLKFVDSAIGRLRGCLPGGNWMLTPKLTLGTHENKVTDHVTVSIRDSNVFLHNDDTTATLVFFFPQPDIDRTAIISKVLVAALVAWRPRQGEPNEQGKRPAFDAVHGKMINAMVVYTSSGSITPFYGLGAYLQRHHRSVVEGVAAEVAHRCMERHRMIAAQLCDPVLRGGPGLPQGASPPNRTWEDLLYDVNPKNDKPLCSGMATDHIRYVYELISDGDMELGRDHGANVDKVHRRLDRRLKKLMAQFVDSVCDPPVCGSKRKQPL